MGSQGGTERRETQQHDGRQVRRQLEEASQQDVHIQLPDWRELLSAHDQLPGDQDWRRRECPRAAVLLREDLPPPTEWHQCERVRRSVGGDNQEDQTSHHQKILQPFNFFGQIYYKHHGLDSHLFLPPMQNRAKMFQKVLEGGLIMESLEKSLD